LEQQILDMTVKRGSKLLIVDPDGKVLVLRRSGTHPHIPFTPDLPGGEIEDGETPIVAACREVYEETNITLQPDDVTQVGMRTYRAFNTDYELFMFVTKLKQRPDVTISWEHDQYDWIALNDIKGLDDGFQPLVDSYRRQAQDA
jgi:8-oxo-dGTP pyrophosphatase MutT (NUDIX family)